MMYIDRALVVSPSYIALCLSEKKFRKEMRRLGVPKGRRPAFVTHGSHATVHFLHDRHGKSIAMVCIGRTDGRTRIEVYGLLVHEAAHVWRAICEDIGERAPSAEFEAYSVQAIAQGLMAAYEKQRRKPKSRKQR